MTSLNQGGLLTRSVIHSSHNSKQLLHMKNDHHHNITPFSKPSLSLRLATHHDRHFHEDKHEDIIDSQKLDQWVRDSAAEIVNNLAESPFLVNIYCNDGTRIDMVKENAIADEWPIIEGRWKGGTGKPTPHGVILVEQLETEETSGQSSSSSSSTRLWGILIQGKGKSCTACYLLKTSHVQLCTHFCLFRVDCFHEHADIQLRKQWLHKS